MGFNLQQNNTTFSVGSVSLILEQGTEGIDGLGWSTLPSAWKETEGVDMWEHDYPPPPVATHPNGVSQIDHIVIRTNDIAHTNQRLTEEMGLTLRKTTKNIYPGTSQSFYREEQGNESRLHSPIVEVVGPTTPVVPLLPPSMFVWGLTFVAPSLAHARDRIGHAHTSEVRRAKQPGREIFTIRKQGSLQHISTNIAFMTPHVSTASTPTLEQSTNQQMSRITNTPIREIYHPNHSKLMPEIMKASSPSMLLQLFHREKKLYGWLTAKETLKHIAKHATKQRRPGMFNSEDPRFLQLLFVLQEAMDQNVMDSTARTGVRSDDLSKIRDALEGLNLVGKDKCAGSFLHLSVVTKMDEEMNDPEFYSKVKPHSN